MLVFVVDSCVGFCFTGGVPSVSFRSILNGTGSLASSLDCIRSNRGGLGFNRGGLCVRALVRGSSSLGSGGRVIFRCGLGDRTSGCTFGETTKGSIGAFVGVVGRFFSNILTREVVGGIGVSSVGLSSADARIVLAMETDPILPLRLCRPALGFLGSSLARTFPTLPLGGRTSPSFMSRSLMIGFTVACGIGFMGLYRAAANFAAMFDGEGMRSRCGSSGIPRLLELLEGLRALMGDWLNLFTLRALPPVQSLRKGEVFLVTLSLRGVTVPTLVAASSAPLLPPVYVLTFGFGFTGGLEKAEDAPRRAASWTLYCVSPVVCGA